MPGDRGVIEARDATRKDRFARCRQPEELVLSLLMKTEELFERNKQGTLRAEQDAPQAD
jgi:hypothetical protein